MTPFALAMPDKYKSPDAVQSYRDFYLGEKMRFAKWAHSTPPPFITEHPDHAYLLHL
jgi:hypothetical protein